jgi:hypothetical protein
VQGEGSAEVTRKQEQAEIIFRFGQFFGPLLKLAENPAVYDTDEQTRIIARFLAEEDAMIGRDWKQFTEGEAGHSYEIQYLRVRNNVRLLIGGIITGSSGNLTPELFAEIKATSNRFQSPSTQPFTKLEHRSQPTASSSTFVRPFENRSCGWIGTSTNQSFTGSSARRHLT